MNNGLIQKICKKPQERCSFNLRNTLTMTAVTHFFYNKNEMTCPICMCDMMSSCICELQCKHIFHTECIFKWVSENKNSCPICRVQFMEQKTIHGVTNQTIENLQNNIHRNQSNVQISTRERMRTIRLLSREMEEQRFAIRENERRRRRRAHRNYLSPIFRRVIMSIYRRRNDVSWD